MPGIPFTRLHLTRKNHSLNILERLLLIFMNKAVIGSKSFLQSNKIEEKQRSSNLGGMRQGKVVAGKNKYFFFGTN